jgi:O-antigen/teichoic acid export membrane protein
MFWLSILIALPISILAKPIIAILFGQAYLGAVGTLSIYVWAGIGISWGTAVTYYLLAENYTGVFLLTTSVGAIINILLNIFLIPRIGIMGGAIATLISYTSAVFALVFYKKTRYQVILMLKSIKFQNL